jgi:hypothetical protein
VAHALEVELRHRVRTNSLLQLTQDPQVKPRPWWKFWQSGPGDGPMSPAPRNVHRGYFAFMRAVAAGRPVGMSGSLRP